MTTLGIILSVLLGIVAIQTLLKERDIITTLGLSGITGLGIQTFVMFILNTIGIRFSATNVLLITAVLIVLFFILYYLINKRMLFGKSFFSGFSFSRDIGYINIVWLICLSLAVYIAYAVSSKALFWPTYAMDALTSFDLYGKALAREGQLINSVILENRVGVGAAYPPLYSLGVAYYYQLGFTNPNIISAVFIFSFVIAFYGLCKAALNSTSAALFTLAVMAIPEFIAQSAVNITSSPQAIYASLAVIAFMTWVRHKEKTGYFSLAALLLGFSGFIRSESIVYMFPVFVAVAWYCFKTKNINVRQAVFFYLLAAMPFILWQLHLKAHIDVMDKFVQVEFTRSIDFAYFNKIFDLAMNVADSSQFYGITKLAFLAAIVASIAAFKKDKAGVLLIGIILTIFISYLLLLSQMKLRADTIENIVNYSGKRFFFGMMILMWFALAFNYHVAALLEKVHMKISKVSK